MKPRICVLVNHNLCRISFSSLASPKTFEEILKVISVPFFIPDFNLLSFQFDNFTFKCYAEFILIYLMYIVINIILRQNKTVKQAVRSQALQSDTLATAAKSYDDIHYIFTFPCEKSKMVSFASSVMKNIIILSFIF